jgi:hypothetical protein
VQVVNFVVIICAAVAGAGIAMVLRTNIGVHQPPKSQRRTANTVWAVVTLIAVVLLAVLLAVSR